MVSVLWADKLEVALRSDKSLSLNTVLSDSSHIIISCVFSALSTYGRRVRSLESIEKAYGSFLIFSGYA
jgi:hypothetical protein